MNTLHARSSQDVWINNFNNLFKKEYVLHFFPSEKYNTNENINSIMRLVIYISVILSVLYRTVYYLIFIVIAGIVTYIYYTIYKDSIREHLKTGMLHNQLFVKEIKSKPYNPVMNKLVGESNDQYSDAYLTSSDEAIRDNILYEYNKLHKNVKQEIMSNDILNQKEALLHFCPLTDKTGIPDFAKFAKNVYGTKVEDRRELVKRGFLSKADKARLQIFEESLVYDPLNTNVNYLKAAVQAI